MIVEATVSETDGGRSRLIAEAATLNPEERVRLVLLLEDPPFAWYEFRTTLTDEARQSIVAVRVEQLRPAFDALEAKLASLPDADVSEDVRFWISPMLSVSVPAKHISDIVQWSELVSMERDDNKPAAENAAYTGFHVRMDTRDYGIGTAGYTGLHGGLSGSGNVRVAALEAEALFDYNHPAFLWPTSLTHRAIALDCGSGSCSSFTPSYGPSPPNSTHPTAVLGIIAGNIEGGQDPNYPNNVGWAQTMRSGQSRDAYIYMMSSTTGNFQTSTNQVAAQQFALSYGLDIMNHSYQNGVGTNNTSYDNTGLNAAISNAVNGGLLNVFASGNLGPAASTVAYPAVRRDGITVGGLDSSNTTQAYTTLGIYTGSDAASIGPMYATIAGTTYSSLSGVDVVAPEYLEDLATVGISPVDTYSTCCAHGTSFAAPIVAGGAALAQNALYSNGYVFTGRLLQTYLFLMNDGWQNAAGVATSNGMDRFQRRGTLLEPLSDHR